MLPSPLYCFCFWAPARSNESSLEKLLAFGESLLLAVVPIKELVGDSLLGFFSAAED